MNINRRQYIRAKSFDGKFNTKFFTSNKLHMIMLKVNQKRFVSFTASTTTRKSSQNKKFIRRHSSQILTSVSDWNFFRRLNFSFWTDCHMLFITMNRKRLCLDHWKRYSVKVNTIQKNSNSHLCFRLKFLSPIDFLRFGLTAIWKFLQSTRKRLLSSSGSTTTWKSTIYRRFNRRQNIHIRIFVSHWFFHLWLKFLLCSNYHLVMLTVIQNHFWDPLLALPYGRRSITKIHSETRHSDSYSYLRLKLLSVNEVFVSDWLPHRAIHSKRENFLSFAA